MCGGRGNHSIGDPTGHSFQRIYRDRTSGTGGHTSSIVPEHDQLSILDLFLDDGDFREVLGDFPEYFTIHEDALGAILENLWKS